MKKKTKIIILIVVLLIIMLIPIGISAASGLKIHFKSDEEIAQANEEENERALKEKANFANTHSANSASKISTQTNNAEEVDIPLLDEKLQESDEKEQKLIEIVKRFYPNEFDAVLAESKNEEDAGMVEMTSSPLKNYERTMYDIVLKILEEENLTEEETNLLKEYINSNMYNIEKDEELNTRAENVLAQ